MQSERRLVNVTASCVQINDIIFVDLERRFRPQYLKVRNVVKHPSSIGGKDVTLLCTDCECSDKKCCKPLLAYTIHEKEEVSRVVN